MLTQVSNKTSGPQ